MPDNHHLLNCPFCGRQPREIVKLTIYHSIVCVCGIVITRDTQEDARTAWNTRVPDTELIEAAQAVVEYHWSENNVRPVIRKLEVAISKAKERTENGDA